MTSKRQIGIKELSACNTLEKTTPNKNELWGSKHSHRRWWGLDRDFHTSPSACQLAGRERVTLCGQGWKLLHTKKIQLRRPPYWWRPVDFRVTEFVPLILSYKNKRRKKRRQKSFPLIISMPEIRKLTVFMTEWWQEHSKTVPCKHLIQGSNYYSGKQLAETQERSEAKYIVNLSWTGCGNLKIGIALCPKQSDLGTVKLKQLYPLFFTVKSRRGAKQHF